MAVKDPQTREPPAGTAAGDGPAPPRARPLTAAAWLLAAAVPAAIGLGLLATLLGGLAGWYPPPSRLLDSDLEVLLMAAAAAMAFWVAWGVAGAAAVPGRVTTNHWSLSVVADVRRAAGSAAPAASGLLAVGVLESSFGRHDTLRVLELCVGVALVASLLRQRRPGNLWAWPAAVAVGGLLVPRLTYFRYLDFLDRLEFAGLALWCARACLSGFEALLRRLGPNGFMWQLSRLVLAAGAGLALLSYRASGLGAAAFVAAVALLAALLADRRRARSAIYPLLLALLIALSALAAPGRPQNRLSVQLLLSDGTSAPLELSLDVDAGTPLPSGCGTDDVTLLVGPSEPALRHPDRWVREWPPVARARWALVIAADDGQEPGVRLADPANRPGAHHVVARTIRDRFNDVAYVISGDGGLMTPKGDVGLAIPLRASWSHPSARGACYLTLPKLADQPQVLNSGFDRGLLPAYADVDTEVRAPAHTDLVAAESVPAPVSEQPDQPPAGWRCGPDHPKTNCQAVAVVEATWADSYLQVALLLAGALISIAADAWLRERPPPAGG